MFSLLLTLALPIIVKGQDAMFNLQLDNDIFNWVDQTDRYYTNGVYFGVYHPVLNKSFVNHILIGGGSFNLQTTGVTLHQAIFTPIDIYTDELQNLDRPYASTLLLGQERVVVSTQNQLRITSSISIGVIGKSAGGEFIQNTIHGLTPYSENANGWQHQISNDFLIDYALEIEKGWFNNRWINVSTFANGQLGTYKDLVGMGGQLTIGLLDEPYSTVFGQDLENDLAINLYLGARMHYLFYDATLEGGVFQNNNAHEIKRDDVNRNQYQTDLGLQIRYKRVVIKSGRIWQSHEFIGAKDHAWGYVSLIIFF